MSQPHNLHRLAVAVDGTEWRCRCGHRGTEPTAELAVAAYECHVNDATYLVRTLAEVVEEAAS